MPLKGVYPFVFLSGYLFVFVTSMVAANARGIVDPVSVDRGRLTTESRLQLRVDNVSRKLQKITPNMSNEDGSQIDNTGKIKKEETTKTNSSSYNISIQAAKDNKANYTFQILIHTDGKKSQDQRCLNCVDWKWNYGTGRGQLKVPGQINLMILPLVLIFAFGVYILVKAKHWCREDLQEADERELKLSKPPVVSDEFSDETRVTANTNGVEHRLPRRAGSVRSGSSISWQDGVGRSQKKSSSESLSVHRKERVIRPAHRPRQAARSISHEQQPSSGKTYKAEQHKHSKKSPIPNRPPVKPLKLNRTNVVSKRTHRRAPGSAQRMPTRSGSTRSTQSYSSCRPACGMSGYNASALRLACKGVPHSESLSPSTTCSSGYSSSVFKYDSHRPPSVSSTESDSKQDKSTPLGRTSTGTPYTPDSFSTSNHLIPLTPGYSDDVFLPEFKYANELESPFRKHSRFRMESHGSVTSLPVPLRSNSTSGHSSEHQSPLCSNETLRTKVEIHDYHSPLNKKDSSYGSLQDNNTTAELPKPEERGQQSVFGKKRIYSIDGRTLDFQSKRLEALFLRRKLARYLSDNEKISMELRELLYNEDFSRQQSLREHKRRITARRSKSWSADGRSCSGKQLPFEHHEYYC